MSFRHYAGAALTVLATAAASAAYAQETSSAVHGTVTSAGAPVAGAAVTVVHTPSGTRAATSTGDTGAFDLRGLRVGGPYTVTINAKGQAPKVLTGITLQVSQTKNLDVDLAEVEELVVTGTTTRNNEQGPKTVLGAEEIAAVVSVSRDPRDLARRDILVAQDLSGGRTGANGGGISIAGSNPRFNRLAVDGVAAQDNFGLAQGGMTTARGPVTLDAIEQFSVAAVPTDVENGDFIGGAFNIVLKSGTNAFHGTGFVNYLNEGLVGKHISGLRIRQIISQKNYGGFVSGPIWKDKLFFAVSYENYKTIDSTQFGVAGGGAPNAFINLTQSTIDGVINTFNTGYAVKYNILSVQPSEPQTDKKYSAKIDWNINDRHRASVTYRFAKSTSIQRTDLGSTTASLASHWYTQLNKDTAVTAELHDNWTDNFSTTFKATYRDYRNGQNPPGGQNFADIQVCTAALSDATLTACQSGFSSVRFGPDQFRHANALDEQEVRLQGLAEYSFQNHRLKFGLQARKAEVFDVFVPQSHGVYYFDSLADFTAGRASRLQYQNAISGNPLDAAFDSVYWTYSAFIQDTADITDDLRVSAGVRLETYHQPDRPTLNPNFKARNGYDNTQTIDKEVLVMPRISAEWKPSPRIKLSAGGGLFAGGTPDVLTGTPFYNNGFETSAIDIQRTATGFNEVTGTGGFTPAIGASALDGLNTNTTGFGNRPSALVQAFQQGNVPGGTGVPALAPVFALSPGFQLPGQYKMFLSGTFDLPDMWRGMTEGVRITADFVQTQAVNEITYYDSRAQPLLIGSVQQFLPDGRYRYDGLAATTPGKTSTNLLGNQDIIVSNEDKGNAWTAGVTISKTFDWGLDLSFGYARQHSNDLGPGLFFGTTAGSLYNSIPAFYDPNRDYKGRSVYEIKNRYKMEVSYAHDFFKDATTRISLFAEHQEGRPFGFTMQDRQSGRSPVFGVTKTAQALYVPDFAAGPSATNPLRYGFVTFATPTDLALFRSYVTNFKIPTGLVQKYTNTNPPINRVDLQIAQDFPVPFLEGHKIKVVADIRNLLNLINRDWGIVGEYADINSLTRVDCADANGAAVPSNNPTCVGYRYSQVPTTVNKNRNTALSLWYAQISLRYQF